MGRGKPQPVKRSPLEQALTSLLEKAGSRDLCTILNTMRVDRPAEERDALLTQIEHALVSFLDLGWIDLVWDLPRGQSIALTDEEQRSLWPISHCVVWHAAHGGWSWRSDAPRHQSAQSWGASPKVVLNDKGRAGLVT